MNIFNKGTTFIIFLLLFTQCKSQSTTNDKVAEEPTEVVKAEKDTLAEMVDKLIDEISKEVETAIILGAAQYEKYLPQLEGKRVGVVTNQTGMLQSSDFANPNEIESKDIHLVDFLISKGVNIQTIFAPEHGFRGKADAGETVKNGVDVKTGIPIISLYGKNKKPYASQIADLDVIIYDIQDVGARFYTYISTMTYVMEAAAENGKKVLILDRPNPNGFYIDGPVLDPKFKSFVGMHPVPIVYGMTPGEYALMVNGERWMKNKVQCDLEVIPLENYAHDMPYELPIKPSPNLPNALSINLYPSTCFFEGTNVSEGRGTSKQFQQYGSPYLKGYDYSFVPEPNEGAKSPRYQGELCYGEDLTPYGWVEKIELDWLLKAHKRNTKSPFWIKNSGEYWIDKLAGTDKLRKQIDQGWTEAQIRESWQKGLDEFKLVREKYLIYP